jgi:hypothetical protein
VSVPRASVLLVCLMVGCKQQELPSPPEWTPGGPASVPPVIVTILTTATTARAYRVTNRFNSDFAASKGLPQIAGYPMLAEADVPERTIRDLAQVLTGPASYLRENESWMCIFEPNHVLHFTGPQGSADVVICFKCGGSSDRRRLDRRRLAQIRARTGARGGHTPPARCIRPPRN